MPSKERPRAFLLISIIILLALFLASLLTLLVALSLPIIRPLYLLQVKAKPVAGGPPTNIATTLQFGIWGFCATGELNHPTLLSDNGQCSPAQLGYNFDPALLEVTGYPEVAAVVEQALSFVLVLHPIVAGLCFLAFICGIPGSRVHACEILTLVLTVIAAIASTVVLGVDFGLIGVIQSQVGPLTGGQVDVQFGNCPWIMLVATIIIWTAVVAESVLTCNCFGLGRRRNWEWDWAQRLKEKALRSKKSENEEK